MDRFTKAALISLEVIAVGFLMTSILFPWEVPESLLGIFAFLLISIVVGGLWANKGEIHLRR